MLKILSKFPKLVIRRLIHGHGLLRNPYTLGVRVIVAQPDNRVLLVRHSYLDGWYLPGGAVDHGETFHDAACREVLEEAGINVEHPATFLGVYLDHTGLGRDHVGLFHTERWSETPEFLQPNSEIVEARFFALDALPSETSPATRNRLAEYQEGRIPASGRWVSGGAATD